MEEDIELIILVSSEGYWEKVVESFVKIREERILLNMALWKNCKKRR